MRTSHLVLALPALATAQQQFPLFDQVKGWFAKATESLSTVVSSATDSITIPDPIASGAAKIAELKVSPLTLENHEELIRPGQSTASPGLEHWMVFVTGGNKTCFGMCTRAEKAFNESVVLISASSSPPRLAALNCESEGVLCSAWGASPPSIMHLQLPQPLADQSTPASTVRYISLNRTTVTAPEIAALHLQDKYLETEPYEGFWHPFDGVLAKYGLAIPAGYVVWAVSLVPSWAFMIGISFLSRTFMSRRTTPPAPANRAAAAPAAQ